MKSFEDACKGCPLRTKVNLEYAETSMSMGQDGTLCELSDGAHSHTVRLDDCDVIDTDVMFAAKDAAEHDTRMCDGPIEGTLRTKCGAGLASAWRWAEICKPTGEPDDRETITRHIVVSNRQEAYIAHQTESTFLVGGNTPEANLFNRPYDTIGYFRLDAPLRGTSTEFARGTFLLLDRANSRDRDIPEDLYKLRVYGGGPQFAFRYCGAADRVEAERHERMGDLSLEEMIRQLDGEGHIGPEGYIEHLAYGIEQLLSSSPEDMRESEYYDQKVGEEARKHRRLVEETFHREIAKHRPRH